MSKNFPGNTSNRQLKIGELVRHKISEEILRGSFFENEDSSISVTVTEVRMSSNLKSALVYVLPLQGEFSDLVLSVLDQIAPKLQGKISRSLGLRFTPKLKFKIDETFDYVEKIDNLIGMNKK